MSFYSQNVFVKVWIVLNVVLGIASGSFFAYESHKSCGDIITAGMITCFLFSFINLVLLGFTQLWNKYLNIFNVFLFIGFSIIAFVIVSEINKESICENQWCIAKGVDSADFLSSFKASNNDDIDGLVSKFCQTKMDIQKKSIQVFASIKYKVIIAEEDIWYIDNSAPFAMSAMVGSMCLLMCILLIADTIRSCRHKHKKSLLV